jgi:hypothetical protein
MPAVGWHQGLDDLTKHKQSGEEQQAIKTSIYEKGEVHKLIEQINVG